MMMTITNYIRIMILFISFVKSFFTTFRPVTLAFIRFEVIHKFKKIIIKRMCRHAHMRRWGVIDSGYPAVAY